MSMVQLDLNPSAKKLRQFGWVAPIMLLAIGLVLRWRVGLSAGGLAGLCLFGILLYLISRMSPRLIRPVYVGLTVIGFPVGWLMSHLLMLFFYFGIVTPVALIFRLLGRDMLHRQRDCRRETYWTEPPRRDSVTGYFRQF